jgi:hypothetical protein
MNHLLRALFIRDRAQVVRERVILPSNSRNQLSISHYHHTQYPCFPFSIFFIVCTSLSQDSLASRSLSIISSRTRTSRVLVLVGLRLRLVVLFAAGFAGGRDCFFFAGPAAPLDFRLLVPSLSAFKKAAISSLQLRDRLSSVSHVFSLLV